MVSAVRDIGRRTKGGEDHGRNGLCGEMMDAADLKLKFWRFLWFALLIKSRTVYLGKSPKSANLDCILEGE
jgi:hypothetical protein